MIPGVRSRPFQLMSAAGSWQSPVAAPRSGRPGKNERPPIITGFTPFAIMSPSSDQLAHPDKAGRCRAHLVHLPLLVRSSST